MLDWNVQPPAISPSGELRWSLRTAFAESPGDLPPLGLRASRVIQLCRQLDLSSRVAKVMGEELVQCLGQEAGRTLLQHQLAVAASNTILTDALHKLAVIAEGLHTPIALLKFCALSVGNIISPGARDARDIDVLASSHAALILREHLLSEGFKPLLEGDAPSLSPLIGEHGEIIEIHESVPGITVPSMSRPATFEDLHAADLLESAAAPSGCWIPRREVLAAHALVHGLQQHAASPASYPSFRFLSDLVDLLPSPIEDAAFERSCLKFVLNGRTKPYVAPALRVARLLRAGKDPLVTPMDSYESLIFRHALAACCDPRYQEALKLARLAQLWRQRGLLAAVRRALAPNDSQAGGGSAFDVRPGRIQPVLRVTRDFTSAVHSWLRLRGRAPLLV